jgi:hypothetical protein
MIIKTIAIYTFFDDILISINDKEPINRTVNDAEILTVIILATYFGGNMETAINFVRST